MFRNSRRKKLHMPVNNTKEEPNQENVRNKLTKELETVVKAAISSPYTSVDNVPSEITQNLCNSIEAIFIHGLRDPFFLKGTRYAKYPEPNFWPFVSKYSHKSLTNQIVQLKLIKSEIGKSRAWIRIVLNENSLNHYLDLLSSEKSAIKQFYGEEAFLRYLGDNEYSEKIRGILKPLSNLPIYAATNSSFLNSWTPTPLILAGLMDGQPLKVGELKPSKNPRKGSETEEVGASALDILAPEDYNTNESPVKYRRRRMVSRSNQNFDDDDKSSVYSHPSLIDSGGTSYQNSVLHPTNATEIQHSSSQRIQLPQSPLFTSTPVEETILDSLTNENNKNKETTVFPPLVVTRRKKRPSNNSKSRSSSESASRVDQISIRVSRSNSDMPATIFGTMPADVSVSLDNDGNRGLNFVADTTDSGICESENRNSPSSNTIKNRETLSSIETSSNCFSTEDCDVNNKNNENIEQSKEETIGEDEVFNVDIGEESNALENETPQQKGNGEENKVENNAVEIINDFQNQSDSILGTSLRDELMQVLPSNEGGIYENGAPIYVQSPLTMGNSLAAIGARNQMWESRSLQSGLSSSSESGGPIVSFGQALRSAMNEATDELNQSLASYNVSECDEQEFRSRNSSKSSVSAEIETKLCVLPQELGLDAQDFRCSMCMKSVGGSTFAKFDICAIDGMYYCLDCMKNGGKSAIPSRVLLNWDWKERSLSDRGRSWLEANEEKALMDIEKSNPQLYVHVKALEEIRKMREKLQLASMYLFSCRESVAEDFRRRVWPKQYLYNNIHLYSFADLIEVNQGTLKKKIESILRHAISHVMTCTLCRQKGFVCELCPIDDVIYPFQIEDTYRCSACFSVFHKQCFNVSAECPKCLRRRTFDERRALSDDPCAMNAFKP